MIRPYPEINSHFKPYEIQKDISISSSSSSSSSSSFSLSNPIVYYINADTAIQRKINMETQVTD